MTRFRRNPSTPTLTSTTTSPAGFYSVTVRGIRHVLPTSDIQHATDGTPCLCGTELVATTPSRVVLHSRMGATQA